MERLLFDDPGLAQTLFGPQNIHLQILAGASGARLFNRGNTLFIETEDRAVQATLVRLFLSLYEDIREGRAIEEEGLAGLYAFFASGAPQRERSKPKKKATEKTEKTRKEGIEKESPATKTGLKENEIPERKTAELNPSGKSEALGPTFSIRRTREGLRASKGDTNETSLGTRFGSEREEEQAVRPSFSKNTLEERRQAQKPLQSSSLTTVPAYLRRGTSIREGDGVGSTKTFTSLQTPKKTVTARNPSQQTYIELLRSHEIVFAVGPAGTGKTYLAVAHAVQLLQQHSIQKLILTRPAVEAGEKLGFLPGDLIEKINPYLRPLYDALYDMLPQAKVAALCELGSIEIAPLAFMRGRTLNDSCIILDEAQNTTREQMKMFLTRMGFSSRMIITGDTTQIDLPQDARGEQKQSGLVHAISLLQNIRGIAFHTFSKEDVVRHALVGEIVNAYDIAENRRENH